jgi:hypothetical protein
MGGVWRVRGDEIGARRRGVRRGGEEEMRWAGFDV